MEEYIEEYVRNELEKEDYLIFSEYFSTDEKLESLMDKYMIHNSYFDVKEVEKNLKNNIKYLLDQEISLLKLIKDLKNIKCPKDKKTVLSQEVKLIIKNYKKHLMDNTLFKTFKCNTKKIQKSNIDSKIQGERINCNYRIKLLKNIDKLMEIKEKLTNDKIKEKIKNKICNKNICCEEIGEDIIIYNPKKIILHKIDSLKKYVSEMIKIYNKCKNGSSLFYRGHADIKWKLIPSIYREQWIKKEDILFREMITKKPNEFRNCNSAFQKLTKMQHYELPTRLLDITSNPLVALFFACINSEKSNGEIHIFKVKNENIAYYDSDTVSVISNLAKINLELNLKVLPSNREKFNEEDEIKKLVHQIKEEKPYFECRINPKDLCKTVYVKPKLDNERIIRQSGAFILFGIENNKFSPARLSTVYKQRKKIHKYIIPNNNKKEILRELKLFGISYSLLFPEIDKTSLQLKKEYK